MINEISITPTTKVDSITPTTEVDSITPTTEVDSNTPTTVVDSNTPTTKVDSITPTTEVDSITPTTEVDSNTPTTEVDSNTPTNLYGVRCLSSDNVKVGKLIGCGCFCDIFEGILDDTTIVAIKRVSSNGARFELEMLEVMPNELEILARLQKSDMIVRIIGYYYTELHSELSIVMEYAENGNLRDFLRKGNLKGSCE
ncbi:kinase-like domain-containing protein [Jimgerdemannia flammicorona]|uniref:Kinase-like domain-containing protein n=1 Tax=Jimgerdemannia flammicorona TaxID=994334 RepID=A0A433DGH1_9FUNG|nr:kinase-like domain-containing protein [Jimgerdemannia flammicorona]